jgi:hypothetical protein
LTTHQSSRLETVYLSNCGEQTTSDISTSFFATNKVELVWIDAMR